MVQNKSYNNVVNTLLRLGEYHEQINTTSVGDIFDISLEKDVKYPLLHINPTNVGTGDSELVLNFQVFIMDMVTEKADWTKNNADANFPKLVKTLSNEQDVLNETLQIATDFIGMLRHSEQQSLEGTNDINQPIYFTEGQYTLEPFSERFDNVACGWVFSIGVKVMNDFSTCNIPVTSAGAGY